MRKKQQAPKILTTPTPTVSRNCLEIGCHMPAVVEDFCRLHFIKYVALKAEARKENIRVDRRRHNRLEILEGMDEDDNLQQMSAHHILKSVTEMDMDVDLNIEDLEALAEPSKKTGS